MFRSALGIVYGRTKNLQRFSKNVILPQEGEKETWNNIDMALAAFGKCLWPSRAVGYLPPSAAPLLPDLASRPVLTALECSLSHRVVFGLLPLSSCNFFYRKSFSHIFLLLNLLLHVKFH